ncbi:unnamed protein product [Schistocephalus solidus]|uniref:Secreted protein n=1 Tax=Schistocephalus solidus TaxID=70667 RepID=A0A183TLN1_SCHSO|nr:unnamed protein product [Schistocephalus solidus]
MLLWLPLAGTQLSAVASRSLVRPSGFTPENIHDWRVKPDLEGHRLDDTPVRSEVLERLLEPDKVAESIPSQLPPQNTEAEMARQEPAHGSPVADRNPQHLRHAEASATTTVRPPGANGQRATTQATFLRRYRHKCSQTVRTTTMLQGHFKQLSEAAVNQPGDLGGPHLGQIDLEKICEDWCSNIRSQPDRRSRGHKGGSQVTIAWIKRLGPKPTMPKPCQGAHAANAKFRRESACLNIFGLNRCPTTDDQRHLPPTHPLHRSRR